METSCGGRLNLAFWEEVPVAIFSLEATKHQLLFRMLSILSGVPLRNIQIGFVSDSAWREIEKLGIALAEKPLYVDDSPRLTTMELREKSKRLREERSIAVVFVDYLQLLRGPFRRNTRQEELADISMELKAIAKELNIPVVALSQLSRQVERRGDGRPQLVDLRGSGQIEEVADIVLFIHGAVANKLILSPEEGGIAEVIVAKNRQGPTGIVKLAFERETTGFRNYTGYLWKGEDQGEEESLPEDLDFDF
jgi:replicative DNA helicase